MFIKRKKGWEIPESQATPEAVFRNRRGFLTASVAGAAAIGSGAYLALSNGDGASADQLAQEIGRASCRERVSLSV